MSKKGRRQGRGNRSNEQGSPSPVPLSPSSPGMHPIIYVTVVGVVFAVVCGAVAWKLGRTDAGDTPVLTRATIPTWQARPTTGPAAGYIGSASCAECHQGISESFAQMAMGRSMYKPAPENIIEDYTGANEFYHEPSQQYFRMLHENGNFYQVRFQKDPAGNIINQLRVQVSYIVGSGNHARSYLHEEPDGKLYQLPVAWYPQEKKWAMNPGYDSAGHMGFTRRITYECLFCHAGMPSLPAGADRFNYAETSMFPPGGMHSIDCERCHGPAEKHVALARARASAEELRDSIVNPAELSTELQLDTCMQCHLETTSGKLPHSVQAVGREIYSYRPGESLGDYRVNFDHPKGAGHDDKFEIAGQAYRMRMSKCFTDNTHGQMTCTTCHDPHRVPKDRIANGIQSCRTCHLENRNDCVATLEFRMTANDNCIQCHMPRRRTDDAVHVVMTDHFIQRFREPETKLVAPKAERPTSYKGRVELYYPARLTADLKQLYLGLAHVVDEADVSHGLELLDAFLRKDPAVFEAVFVRGIGRKILGRYSDAQEDLERAVKMMPTTPQVHMALGDLYEQMGSYHKSVECYRKAVELAPTLARAHNGLGASLFLSGDVDGAIASYRRAVAVDPFNDHAHFNLGNAHLQRGEYKAAEAANRTALVIQPNVAEGWNSLAQALAGQKRQAEAAWHCAEALRLDPSNAGFFQFLSDLLIGMDTESRFTAMRPVQEKLPFAGRVLMAGMQVLAGDKELAEQHLLESQAYQTTNTAVYTYAGQTAASVGRHELAESWLRAAMGIDPQMEDAITGLASVLRAQGKEAEAEALLVQSLSRVREPGARLLNGLAWLRATAKDPSLRNGREAEELARRAGQLVGRPNLFIQGTLAAALAEQGKYSEAHRVANEALRLAREADRPSEAAELQAQVEKYAAGEPHRAER